MQWKSRWQRDKHKAVVAGIAISFQPLTAFNDLILQIAVHCWSESTPTDFWNQRENTQLEKSKGVVNKKFVGMLN